MFGAEAETQAAPWKQKVGQFFGNLFSTALNAGGKVLGDQIANKIGAPTESPVYKAAQQQAAQQQAAAASRSSAIVSTAKSAWPILAVAGGGLAALAAVIAMKRKSS